MASLIKIYSEVRDEWVLHAVLACAPGVATVVGSRWAFARFHRNIDRYVTAHMSEADTIRWAVFGATEGRLVNTVTFPSFGEALAAGNVEWTARGRTARGPLL